MRVAWVSHFPFTKIQGGAEQADADMASQAPEGVEVIPIHPRDVAPSMYELYDRIVVTGLEGLAEGQIPTLSDAHPVMWAHRNQDMFPQYKQLYESCCVFIALTPQHLAKENAWLDLKNVEINPGWFQTNECYVARKENIAVWPHRNIAHKGLDRALEWSKERSVPLIVLTDVPHYEVLEVMATARFIVLLSHIFDAGPRAIMEGQLSMCQPVVDNVGWFNENPDKLKARIDRAGREFWEMVLS